MRSAGERRLHGGSLLAGTLLLATALHPSPAAVAQASELAPGVHLIRGALEAGKQPDGNTVVFEAPDGLVVVDTGRHPAHTEQILGLARSLGKPIAVVVNTHWHLDHLGGNPRIRDGFPAVQVWASAALDGALEGFLARYRDQLDAEIARLSDDPEGQQPLRAELAILDSAPRLRPDRVIESAGPQTLAGKGFHVGLERHAVTAGDVWLLDPASGILVAGDLVTLPAPFLDTACPERWRETLGRLMEEEFRLLVPGHGPALDRESFEEWTAAYEGILDCASSERESAACVEGWLGTLGPLVPEADLPLARAYVGYYVDQVLRGDPTRLPALCGVDPEAPGPSGPAGSR